MDQEQFIECIRDMVFTRAVGSVMESLDQGTGLGRAQQDLRSWLSTRSPEVRRLLEIVVRHAAYSTVFKMLILLDGNAPIPGVSFSLDAIEESHRTPLAGDDVVNLYELWAAEEGLY